VKLAGTALLVWALVLAGPSVGPTVAQEATSLRGQWRLNAAASDLGGAPSEAETPGPRGGRAPMGGGGFGGPGVSPFGGMRGRPPMDAEAMKQRRDLIRELLEPVQRFTLEHDATMARFTYADGRQVTYRTNGKAEKHQATNGVVETETRWQKGALVRETHLDDGLRITETFTRPAPEQLTLTVKMSGGPLRGARPLTRVYELESGTDPDQE